MAFRREETCNRSEDRRRQYRLKQELRLASIVSLEPVGEDGVQHDVGRTYLSSVTLDQSGVDGIGHGERRHILSQFIGLDFVGGEGR